MKLEYHMKILNDAQPIRALTKAVVNEFHGPTTLDTKHYSTLFMVQRLCDLGQLENFKCDMQKILYKT